MEQRLETEKAKLRSVQYRAARHAHKHAFAKQADRITRYYDRGLFLSLSLSFFPMTIVLCAAAFGKSDNLARQ